ncbi:NADPH:quinone oxidoreductase family protein [Sphingomonas sp.]|uniref:NADPH:quinone oxidoreductase family protein n=1 Tax=Sphingomonas sp. TaxID=28214 RepID=UPI002FCBE345
MKALMSVGVGGPETLQLVETAMPEPGAGELRVRIIACSINYPDALILEDKYQLKPERPFAPGGEVAGVVDALGPGVEGWAPGDRLIAITFYGGLAEYAVVPVANAFRLPADMPFAEGAALLITYGTTIHALVDRGEVQPGETLLVLGAAGGTGVAAIEIGKALGAKVVAAVSSEEKAEAARRLGADAAMVYGRGPFDKEASKALSASFKAAVGPDGANAIYDPVGGDYAEPALRAIAWEGRYLVIGFPAGIPRLPLNLALLKGCDIRGVLWAGLMARDPERVREHVAQLFHWWSEGKIRPSIQHRFPLERGGEAIAWLSDRKAIGKIVVEVGAG